MSRCRDIFKHVLPGLLFLLCVRLGAQEDALAKAQELLKAKKIDSAMVVIDSAVVHPQTKGDPIAWTMRAYIYFEKYKRTEKLKLNSSLRDTIVRSLRASQSLKPDSTYIKNNRNLLMNLAAGYYNIGKAYLQDSVNYELSHQAYEKYKEVYSIADSTMNFRSKDIEYYLAVGSQYSEVFTKDNKNTAAGDVAKVALLKILDIQPDHPNALMNMGLMYYNQAVNLSKSLGYDADISEIDIVQDNMVKLAKQAEQFITKVYNADNKNPKAVEALYYIYRMLSEFQKSEQFKAKCKDLGINVDQSATQK
jgi:hypothetical protein